ncbi:uncharacterized protein [Clytia hemisphaerica]|uniref:uncharacterized protein isoform X2 n=1 Tax=Clytia hemisphaerica TaxID=252671 RepID=UPI0034D48F78
MVHSITPEDDMKLFDKKQSAKRFAYNGMKSKKNSWDQFEEDGDSEKFVQQTKIMSPNHLSHLGMKHNQHMIDLDNVWSIRNVSLKANQSDSISSSSLVNKTDTYSRHKGLFSPLARRDSGQRSFLSQKQQQQSSQPQPQPPQPPTQRLHLSSLSFQKKKPNGYF